MPLYTLEDFYPDYQDELFGGDEIKGLPVYTETEEKVGTISGALVDQSGHFRYLIMDTGFWIFGKQVLLPVEQVQSSPENQRLYLKGLSKSEAAMLPQYDENAVAELGVDSVAPEAADGAIADAPVAPVAIGEPRFEVATSDPDTADSNSSDTYLLDSPAVSVESTQAESPITEGELDRASAETTYRNRRTASDTALIPDPSDYATTTDELPVQAESPVARTAAETLPATPATAAVNTSMSATPLTDSTHSISAASEQVQSTDLREMESQTIPVYEERLQASKQRQMTGAITVGKRVETETAHVAVPVEKERIVIERHPSTTVGQVVSITSNDFQTQEIARIELFEETVEIQRQPVVREEIRIRKEVSRETLSAEESLRREELEIQTEGDPSIDWNRG
jgi:uncharacterized protein (TIGR02271 family)